MKTKCTECGALHEVGKSQQHAQMFCLECDNFFQIEEEKVIAAVFKKSLQSLGKEEKKNIDGSLKNSFKNIFSRKNKNAELELKPKFEADPPKMSENSLSSNAGYIPSIDDFLDPETDYENEPEDVPAEYIDFLSVGLDVSSSDLIEHHGKIKADGHSPQKDQE
ncbi:MAG: hypothetical protein KOO69_04080 [Victivallales bacterium]|nr:hypothetical protein [Victivallales bacterium]